MRVDVGILTRQRPVPLRRAINAALANASNAYIHIAYDGDNSGYDYFAACLATTRVRATLLERSFYVMGVNKLFYFMQHEHDLGYFCIINDDSEFMLPDWDRLLVESYDEKFPDGLGVLSLDGADKCGQIFSHARTFNTLFDGYINNPVYMHYYADAELLNRLEELDKIKTVAFEAPKMSDLQFPVLRHNAIEDHLRLECRHFYAKDKATYEARCADKTIRV